MTTPTGPHWLLRHPDVPGVCLLKGNEVDALWEAGSITAEIEAAAVNLVSLDEFLVTARKAK